MITHSEISLNDLDSTNKIIIHSCSCGFYCCCCLSALEKRFADIFFLVDSGLSTAEFQQVRSLLVRLVNQLNVGASGYRFGVAQFGQEVKVEFLLNAFQTKEETQAAMRRLRQRRLQANEPRNQGVAMDYASRHFFTKEAGGRADQGFREFLVVVSGKISDDDLSKASRLLKSQGIIVMAIPLRESGVTHSIMDEVGGIATSYIYPSTNIVPDLKAAFEMEEREVALLEGENFKNK